MSKYSADDIRKIARDEHNAELFRAAIDAQKVRLRAYVPWYNRILPFTITIKWREKNE